MIVMSDVSSSKKEKKRPILTLTLKWCSVVLPSMMLALAFVRQTVHKRSLGVFVSASQKPLAHVSQTRSYAKRRNAVDEDGGDDFAYHKGKKGKQGKDANLDKNNITDPSLRFVPASSMPHGAAYDAEEKSADEKMGASVRWLKEAARGVEVRSSGRVIPDVLDPVRVRIKLDEGAGENGEEMEVGLKEVASVGVRNGNVLVVTVFEEEVSLSREDGGLMLGPSFCLSCVDDQGSGKGTVCCEITWLDTTTIRCAHDPLAGVSAYRRVAECAGGHAAEAGRGDQGCHSQSTPGEPEEGQSSWL